MELKNVIENVKDIYMTDSSLAVLLDFERVLDNAHMYAYKNWINGELASGPEIDRHWVTCKFMYPYKMMPDPTAAKRLLDYNCKVTYEEDELTHPVKVETPEDFEPGTKKPKSVKKKIWVVSIRMPKSLLEDSEEGFMEMAGKQIENEELDQAWEEDLNQESAMDGGVEEEIDDELDFDLEM